MATPGSKVAVTAPPGAGRARTAVGDVPPVPFVAVKTSGPLAVVRPNGVPVVLATSGRASPREMVSVCGRRLRNGRLNWSVNPVRRSG